MGRKLMQPESVTSVGVAQPVSRSALDIAANSVRFLGISIGGPLDLGDDLCRALALDCTITQDATANQQRDNGAGSDHLDREAR